MSNVCLDMYELLMKACVDFSTSVYFFISALFYDFLPSRIKSSLRWLTSRDGDSQVITLYSISFSYISFLRVYVQYIFSTIFHIICYISSTVWLRPTGPRVQCLISFLAFRANEPLSRHYCVLLLLLTQQKK